MSFVFLMTLLGLALVDSTSLGTIGVPIFLTVARTPVRRVVLYLATITVFYFVVGVALLLGINSALTVIGSVFESRAALVVQLFAGAALFVLSFRFDARKRAGRPKRSWEPKNGSASSMVGLALTAGIVEITSMVPYIAAIGMLIGSDLSTLARIGIIAGYTTVMALPALALLGLSRIGAPWVDRLLEWAGKWIERNAEGMLGWMLGIVGFFLAANAIGSLA
jgi:hypothetical protein